MGCSQTRRRAMDLGAVVPIRDSQHTIADIDRHGAGGVIDRAISSLRSKVDTLREERDA